MTKPEGVSVTVPEPRVYPFAVAVTVTVPLDASAWTYAIPELLPTGNCSTVTPEGSPAPIRLPMISFVESLLVRVTLSGPPETGVEILIWICVWRFFPTDTLFKVNTPAVGKETVAVVVLSGMFNPFAWRVAEPSLSAVTGTFTVLDPARNVTEAGTLATSAFEELRFTTRPPSGAGPESVSTTFWVPNAVSRTVDGHVTVAAILTDWLDDV
jgi:hypothetical protein